MADIKKISKSDYALAQKWAIKYDITISQAVKRFEDIEELEAATGKQKDAVQAEMYARLKWATLAPITEHEDTPAADSTLADELPAYRTPETPSTTNNALANAIFGQEVANEKGFNATPTGPDLTSEMEAALKNHNVKICYLTTDPIATCECPVCKKPRLEAEIAALKARVAELQHERNFIGAMFERARDVTYSSLTGEAFNRDWLNRLEQLYMQVAKFHPLPMTDKEIESRADDYNDAHDAGQGVFF